MTVSGGGRGSIGVGTFTGCDVVSATVPNTTTPTSTTATITTTIPHLPLPSASSSRQRRESSDEFGTAGSLGSIGGSEVGSSVHSATRNEKEESGENDKNADGKKGSRISSSPIMASSMVTTVVVTLPAAATIPPAEINPTQRDSPLAMPAPPPPPLVSTPQKQAPPSSTHESTEQSCIPFENQTTPQVKNTSSNTRTVNLNFLDPPSSTTNTTTTTIPVSAATVPTVTTTTTTTTAIRKSSLKSESSLNSTMMSASTASILQQPLDHPTSIPNSQRPPKKRKGSVDFTLDHPRYPTAAPSSTSTPAAAATAATTLTTTTTTAAASKDMADPTTFTMTDDPASALFVPLDHSIPPPLSLMNVDAASLKYRSGSDSSPGYSLGRLLRADTLDSYMLGQGVSTPATTTTRVRADTLERLDALGDEARRAAARIRTNSAATTLTTSTSSIGIGIGSGSGSGIRRTTTVTTTRRNNMTSQKSLGSLSNSSRLPSIAGTTTTMTTANVTAAALGTPVGHSLPISHRLLLEAFMGGDDTTHNGNDQDDDDDYDDDDDDEHDDPDEDEDHDVAIALDDDAESLVDSHAAEQAETQELTKAQGRERFESFDHHVRDRLGSFDHHVRDRLGSFDVRERLGSFDVGTAAAAAAHHQYTFESLRRRDRLESWGGMSDLSIPVPDSIGTDSLMGLGSAAGGSAGGIANSTAALAAAVYTSLANDLSAAANLDGNESISDFLVQDDLVQIPSKISMSRDRLNSVHSAATDPSISQLPTEQEIPSEIQEFVKEAMASVGDQLAGMAVAATGDIRDLEDHSEISSTASPLIGAILDGSSKIHQHRPRSSSLTPGMDIAVDYAAVAAAVNAAEAAAGAIDLTVFAHSASASVASNASSTQQTASGAKRKRPNLPTKKIKKSKTTTPTAVAHVAATKPKQPIVPIELPPIPKSKLDERDMEIIRERARAAAGYVPPTTFPLISASKKKSKLDPQTPSVKGITASTTPRMMPPVRSSITTPYTPASSYMSTPGSARSSASKGQSSQKWDSMYDCLLAFVEERRKEETVDMTEAEKKEWIWDGNVPTTFKSKDGKALGRWINNQRSAKSKGALKDDREQRLIDAGLKWSVLASNSWNEMLDELRVYVNEQTKAGRKWDGNVPTNYRISTKPGVVVREDEDKNLGRWVNRQRSLYQSGKLRKDRQLALEGVGLKWSMLATTPWECMYESLLEYIQEKSEEGGDWDGNVPANHRTTHVPPRALGRWINRQRSAYGKDKLRREHIDKLNRVGLKWSVHERRPGSYPDTTNSAVISAPSSGNDSDPMPNDALSSAVAPVTHGSPPPPSTGVTIKTVPDDEEKMAASVSRSCNSSNSSTSSSDSDEMYDEAPSNATTPATCGPAGCNPAPTNSEPEKEDNEKKSSPPPAAESCNNTDGSGTGKELSKDDDALSRQSTTLPVASSSNPNIP